jgi:hypothetical protein
MIFMGLLEKAGNIQTNEKEPAKKSNVAAAEIKAFDAAVVDAAVVAKPTRKAKKAQKAKAAKAAKKPKAAKAPRVRKERVIKVLPEGFEEVGRARSTGLWLIDSIVNWGLLMTIVLAMAFFDSDYTYFMIGCILICISNLILMPLWTKKTIGNWITMTQYVNTRGNTPNFFFHIMKNLRIPMNLTGVMLFLFWLPVILSGSENPSLVATLVGIMFFSMSIADTVVRRLHAQNFGLWEFSFGGIWLVKTLRTESTGGNKFLKRLESLSDYSESKGWLEDKEN